MARSLAFSAAWVLGGALACNRERPPGDEPAPAETTVTTAAPAEVAPSAAAPSAIPAPSTSAAPTTEAEYAGPWFAVTSGSAGVYSEPSTERKKKIGYLQSGERTPVDGTPVEGPECTEGWYRVVPNGYVCGHYGTTDLASSRVKLSRKPPNLETVLPYVYARNATNGTPLYRAVPTREQMYEYEPYLPGAKKAASAKGGEDKTSPVEKASAGPKPERDKKPVEPKAAGSADPPRPSPSSAPLPSAALPTVAPSAQFPLERPPDEEGPTPLDAGAAKPWWQRENIDESLHEVTLEELEAEGDDVLAKRMVRGFYVAVDRTFSWNERTWYKTTKGLVAPADRMWVTNASEFKGVVLDDEWKLPIGWPHGWQKTKPKFEIDADGRKVKPAGTVAHFEAILLTGRELTVGGKKFLESTKGFWVRTGDVRVPKPGPPPADLAPGERWIDVSLSTQTLVAFEGTKAVFATLISSGKSSTIADKDHSTPTGEWRIREKHLTTTMDGDGSAAGDLPYSIEDVPYVMYFHKAYALHGAFWHANYGVQMSHGCVNLAPLDAKYLFFFTEPGIPRGWHGAWALRDRPGSRVIVHE